jgi:hypothetical protein
VCRERVGILTTCHACSEEKLEALQQTVDELSQRLRHPRTGLSDQDAARYRTTIQELDGKLRCAEAQLADKDKIYFKRSGKLTFQLRAALADAVVREGVSMSAAYGTVANSLRHFHGQDCIVGDITHKKAQLRKPTRRRLLSIPALILASSDCASVRILAISDPHMP